MIIIMYNYSKHYHLWGKHSIGGSDFSGYYHTVDDFLEDWQWL